MNYSSWSNRALAGRIIEMSKHFPENFNENHSAYQLILESVFESNRDPRDIFLCGALVILNSNLDAYLFLSGAKKSFSMSFLYSQIRDYYQAGGRECLEEHLIYVKEAFPDTYPKIQTFSQQERFLQVVETLEHPNRTPVPLRGTFVPDFYQEKSSRVSQTIENANFCFVREETGSILKKK